MRCPLVIICREGSTEQPFAVCADMAETIVEALNSPIPDDERGWQVHTVPFDHHELESVMEEMIYGPRPVPTPEVKEDPDMTRLMEVINATPCPDYPISEAYM